MVMSQAQPPPASFLTIATCDSGNLSKGLVCRPRSPSGMRRFTSWSEPDDFFAFVVTQYVDPGGRGAS